MQITRELVEYVADLSRICLDGASEEKMERELGAVIEYMEVLNALDTDGVEPLSHVFQVTNVMREDAVAPSSPREDILAGAPEATGQTFVVPRTLE